MDPYQRGRPSSDAATSANAANIRSSRSPSPNPAFTSQANAFGFDPALLGPANGSLADPLNPPPQFQHTSYSQAQFPQSAPPHYHSSESYSYAVQPDQPQQSYDVQFMSQSQQSQAANYSSLDASNDDLNPDFDSSLYLDFDDPSLIDSQPATGASNDASNPYDNMPTSIQRSPDAPHLLQPGVRQSLDSAAQHSSSFYQDQYNQGASHSRHTSLSPSSATYMGAEYTGMAFQGHRRLPSDQHSDVSSSHASPYLQNHDSFDGQPSPMLNGNQDPSVIGPDHLGLSQFSLSDQHHISPGHSSHPSPNLAPQQGMPLFNGSEGLGMSGMDEQFSGLQGGDSFSGQEAFPVLQQNDSLQDIGQASQMSPPEITFDPAPPSKQPSFNEANPAERQGGALSPPEPAPSRNRQRSRSDPYSSAPSSRSNSPARHRSPSDGGLHPTDSLSAHSRSRSTSPSGPPGGVQKSYRRSSSPAAPSNNAERARMLGIAERAQSPQPPFPTDRAPSPTPSNISNHSDGAGASGPRRVQRHPATFQCHLCPKRFTRAYNLRSHLRTHTDERPFVCTVCGKAFARQHDRKRHEGLHSGEKKFVCRGTLTGQNAGTWGCGRKFARADALGRHFRSEAGRSCIKPLLDEEAREKSQGMMGGAAPDMMHGNAGQMGGGQPHMMGPPQSSMGPVDFNGMPLPAALLQQYPALAGISWGPTSNARGTETNNMGGDFEGSDYGNTSDYGDASGGDFNDYSARSSFEAYDDDENGYKSDAGYGSTLDPSFAHGHGAWPLAGTGGGAMGGPNGYYSDRGGQ